MTPRAVGEMTEEQLEAIRERAEKATRLLERREIPGFRSYLADTDGNIWSAFANWRGYGERPLVVDLNASGYPSVRLYRDVDRVRVRKPVHVLIASAFHGMGNGLQVRHVNGDKFDNRPANLAWGTAEENALDRAQHGTTARGERNGAARLTVDSVRDIRLQLAAHVPQRAIARTFRVSQRTISLIAQRRIWAHV